MDPQSVEFSPGQIGSEKEPCGFVQAMSHLIILLSDAWEPL